MTSNCDFKVTTFFEVDCRKNGTRGNYALHMECYYLVTLIDL